ncbi:LOW QUALITY PROTEIN: hypothetical protein Nmel_004345 [Mimus melanotis]
MELEEFPKGSKYREQTDIVKSKIQAEIIKKLFSGHHHSCGTSQFSLILKISVTYSPSLVQTSMSTLVPGCPLSIAGTCIFHIAISLDSPESCYMRIFLGKRHRKYQQPEWATI